MGIAEVVVVFAASLWYNFSFIPSLGWFALITFFCTLGYVAVGTTFGAVAANTRMREVMLPVLQFPVAVPILLPGSRELPERSRVTRSASFRYWIKLAAGFSIIFVVLSYLLFEYVLEE
jgi:heme exporter protein B